MSLASLVRRVLLQVQDGEGTRLRCGSKGRLTRKESHTHFPLDGLIKEPSAPSLVMYVTSSTDVQTKRQEDLE